MTGTDERTIEKGIPAPGRMTYSFLDGLEVGDSIVVTEGSVYTLAACMQYRQNRDGKKFTRKKVEGGVRVWRVL